jgi:aminopeptidase N
LFVLGVADFAVQVVDRFEGKTIETWVYPKDREAGFHDFAAPTKQVLEFYSGYVGPFVYEKLANIQSPSVGGGMETSSAIFYGENLINGKRDTRLRNVVIHEIAHQWFGNAVTESTWDDAWLSEGFATYFTLLFQEYAYGHDEYVDGLKKARRTIMDFYKKDSTYKIIDERTAESGPVTNNMTYQKGAWFLHMLREKIGHENFRKGIKAYYAKYMNANATTGDFIREMELVSGQDLKKFFHQWLYRPDVLKLGVHWEYDAKSGEVVIDVEQLQSSGFVFQIPVEFHLVEDGRKPPQLLRFDLSAKKSRFRVAAPKRPVALLADPRVVLLAEVELR